MGKNKGKTRTKNNAKPSSSARAAELLGAAATNFAGFSANPELGMIAFAPGFASFDTASEHFDPNIDQLILQVFRKMMKKDPVTKQKAIQEFIEVIKSSEVEKLNGLLPLWPKHYQTLSIDVEHNVREAAQRANELLIMKCKKSARPYIKFLFPSWMAGQFDIYAPVASVTSTSFKNAFAATTDKTADVCVLCQTEIMDHLIQNLVHQTASLYASSLQIDLDEAERKYHLVLLSNLRALGYFIERTSNVADESIAKTQERMKNLICDPKFISLAKNKSSSVKSAWFESCYRLIESPKYPEAVAGLKTHVISICFNHIDETDPIVAPNVWLCTLAVQNKFEDWYMELDFKKTIAYKLRNVLKNGLKRHVHTICPHLLPFISKIDQQNLQNYDIYEFYDLIFENLLANILNDNVVLKSDYAIVTKTFFECLRYVLKKLCTLNVAVRTDKDQAYAEKLLNTYLIEAIVWFLNHGNIGCKYFFQHTSSLISYMNRNSGNAEFLYEQLLKMFWLKIFDIMSNELSKEINDTNKLNFIEHSLEFVHNMHALNPFVEEHKVKFASVETYNFKTAYNTMACLENTIVHPTTNATNASNANSPNNNKPNDMINGKGAYIEKEVKELSRQLLDLCMRNAEKHYSLNYIEYVYHLMSMYKDEEFYKTLATDGQVMSTLNRFASLLKQISSYETNTTLYEANEKTCDQQNNESDNENENENEDNEDNEDNEANEDNQDDETEGNDNEDSENENENENEDANEGNDQDNEENANENELMEDNEKENNCKLNHYYDAEENNKAIDVLLNIIFQLLESPVVERSEKFHFIEQKLLELPGLSARAQVLQRLLSHPLNSEKEVVAMLLKDQASATISQIAKHYMLDANQDKFNILHKCFFQNDKGEILINTATVDSILSTFIQALLKPDQYQDVVINCGSFIAQVMPIICSNENASKSIQKEVFLALFAFTMQNEVSDYISKDTLWELTTCWQDALSSNDIVIDEQIVDKCYMIIEQETSQLDILVENVETKAEAIAKFIICSTENIENDIERYEKIDELMLKLFKSPTLDSEIVRKFEEQVLFLEALQGYASAFATIHTDCVEKVDMLSILKRTLLNFMTILKLICSESQLASGLKMPSNGATTSTTPNAAGVGAGADAGEVDEVTEDFCDPNENLLKNYSEVLYKEILKSIKIAALGDSLISLFEKSENDSNIFALELSENVRQFMRSECEILPNIVERLLAEAGVRGKVNQSACRALQYLVHYQQFSIFEENATVLLNEHLAEYFIGLEAYAPYIISLQYILPNLEQRVITLQDPIMRSEPREIRIQTAIYRCVFLNNFNGSFGETSDRDILASICDLITRIYEQLTCNKRILLFNTDVHAADYEDVIDVVEYISLLNQMLKDCPRQMTIKNWDAVRVGLTSWILSVSKSIKHFEDPKVLLFISAVSSLFASLNKLLKLEANRSSTRDMQSVIEEWNMIFSREVNTVIFKAFFSLFQMESFEKFIFFEQFMNEVTPSIESVNFSIIHTFTKNSSALSLDEILNFALKNLSNPVHSMRLCCLSILKGLNKNFVADDLVIYESRTDDENEDDNKKITKWHYFNRLQDYICRYELSIKHYIDEFSFKLPEIDNFSTFNRHETLGYLYLWEFIIYACDNAPIQLRAVYSQWLHDNHYEESFLRLLFRAMPPEILKNCNQVTNSECFNCLKDYELRDPNLSIETYACHLYVEVLRKLPALVRTWWSSSESRQKTFVDRLTRSYVSSMLCNEELKGVASKKEKHDNMQITVLTSTREMLAVYSIDEVRMELVVTLAPNHPLGGVKVVLGKQIGGRLTVRNVGMQLTLFLTHQNGSLFDGLTLWKNNLDKKFSGVEECFVCYNVIHQETCQLPRVTCRTCKKKFHSPCLYKWFTTSSKSTCPICRNIF